MFVRSVLVSISALHGAGWPRKSSALVKAVFHFRFENVSFNIKYMI